MLQLISSWRMAFQAVGYVFQSSCQLFVELLLRLPDSLRQFEARQLETVLDQSVPQDEEGPQLRLPSAEAVAEREILPPRGPELEENTVGQRSHCAELLLDRLPKRNGASDRCAEILRKRFSGELSQQPQVGDESPLHL